LPFSLLKCPLSRLVLLLEFPQINARTPLALLYNDQSVLEHHHASTFFRIVAAPANNVCAGLPRADAHAVRKLVISAILATDMTCHFSLIQVWMVVGSAWLGAKSWSAKQCGEYLQSLWIFTTFGTLFSRARVTAI
jgi:hypothetical protein